MSIDSDQYAIRAPESSERDAAPQLIYRPRDPASRSPNIALIGCGGITTHHLTAYRRAGYFVTMLCDIDLKRALARQKEFFPDATVCSDYREVLRNDDVRVVDIATHPAERAPIVEAALQAGKHVLSQKPFVLDLDFGERMADLADQKGVRLAVNQNGRWAPHFSYIRHGIEAGLIGDVLSAHLSVHWNHQWIVGTEFEKVHHVVLYDFAIHWFDILTQFLGSKTATRVYASNARSPVQTARPPMLGQVLVEYEGAQATMAFDACLPYGAQDRTYVGGTRGSFSSVGPDLTKQEVALYTADGLFLPELEGSWFPDGFHGTMGELLCAIEEDREPTNGARGNLKSLALCFAALRSADTGEPQTPGSVRRLPGRG